MKHYKLPRTGDRPVAFRGDCVASANKRDRWHEIALYRTDGSPGRFVVEINYQTLWPNEAPHHGVYLASAPDEVVAILKNYNPLDHLVGFPSGEQYREQQAVLERTVARDYRRLVGEVLNAAGGQFAEQVG